MPLGISKCSAIYTMPVIATGTGDRSVLPESIISLPSFRPPKLSGYKPVKTASVQSTSNTHWEWNSVMWLILKIPTNVTLFWTFNSGLPSLMNKHSTVKQFVLKPFTPRELRCHWQFYVIHVASSESILCVLVPEYRTIRSVLKSSPMVWEF